MTPDKGSALNALLAEIREEGYFIPVEAYEGVHDTFSMWAVELIVTHDGQDGTEVLLAPYLSKGEKMSVHNGEYCVPGGFNRMVDQDVPAICNRIARAELGTEVEMLDARPLVTYWWPAGLHGTGRPISILYHVRPLGEITKPEWAFYPFNHLPSPMCEGHQQFLKLAFAT